MSDDPDTIKEPENATIRSRGGKAQVLAINLETDHDGALVATVTVRRPPAGFRIAAAVPQVSDLPEDIAVCLASWLREAGY